MIKMTMLGLIIPLIGTTLGAACVLFVRSRLSESVTKMFGGFAAGVMVAASIWSLLIPAIEQSADMGNMKCLPAVVGFAGGVAFLILLNIITPHMHLDESEEGPVSVLPKTTKMVFAVTLHNIPEGMAIGVLYAGWVFGDGITQAAALTLAIGIAIQNFPEGAIISLPLNSCGVSKKKAFLYGVISGVVEPVAGVITIFAASVIVPVLPYLLSFAAGAMMYVVVEELVPDMAKGKHSNVGTIAFTIGFCLMMTLDIVLG